MWFKKKIEPIFVYEHEVLRTLRRFGLTITQTGNDTDGYDPFDKFQIGTAFLHYGTLVDLMFHPTKYSGQGMIGFHNIKTKRHEVNISPDSWIKAAKAIEVLEMNNHVKDDTTGSYMEISERKILLTKEGLMAINTDHYIKEFKRDKYQDEIHASQIDTNFWMKWLTIVLAGTAILTTIFQGVQCNKENREKQECRQNLTNDTATSDKAHLSGTNYVIPVLSDTTKTTVDTTPAKTPNIKPK